MKPVFALLVTLFTVQFLAAQNGASWIRYGNFMYESGNYSEAENNYRKGLEENPTNVRGTFNLGNAVYEQERYPEAAKHFVSAAALTDDKNFKAEAFYNAGNAYLKDQKLQESVDAYKQSLRHNPKDINTKKNLALALKHLKQQQQQEQEQQQQQDQENQDSENQDQQDQENQDQEQQESKEEKQQQEQDEQEQKDGKKSENNKDQEQSPSDQEKEIEQSEPGEDQPKAQDMSVQEAMKILEVMDNEEKKVQEKLRKGKGEANKTDKDW